ncbi:unnamed protein product [Brassicogethes aeneus]|nr:unnamed protein product [Brassicogethes aeneus]
MSPPIVFISKAFLIVQLKNIKIVAKAALKSVAIVSSTYLRSSVENPDTNYVYYPPFPLGNDDQIKEIHRHVMMQSEPLDSWLLYDFVVLHEADTYEEAIKMLQTLDIDTYYDITKTELAFGMLLDPCDVNLLPDVPIGNAQRKRKLDSSPISEEPDLRRGKTSPASKPSTSSAVLLTLEDASKIMTNLVNPKLGSFENELKNQARKLDKLEESIKYVTSLLESRVNTTSNGPTLLTPPPINEAIPFVTLTEFERFDSKLREDSQLQTVIGAIMEAQLGKFENPSLTTLAGAIIRKFIHKTVAKLYTATHPRGNKNVFTKTIFFRLLHGVLLKVPKFANLTDPRGEHLIKQAVGRALTTSPSWKQPEVSSISETNLKNGGDEVSSVDIKLEDLNEEDEQLLLGL